MKRTSIAFAAAALAAVATVTSANSGTWAPANMADTYMSFTDAANWQDSYVPTNASDSAVFAKVSPNANDRGYLSGNFWDAPIFGYVALPGLDREIAWDSISGIRQYLLQTPPDTVSPAYSARDVSDFLGTFQLYSRSALRIRAGESGQTQQLHGVAIAGRPTVAVDAGTVELGKLAGAGTLVKSGSGALDLAGVSAAPGARIHAEEGVVRLGAAASAQSPVPGMALHVDASRAYTVTVDGNGVVQAVSDVRGPASLGFHTLSRYDGKPSLVSFGDLAMLNFGYDTSAAGDKTALAARWGDFGAMALDEAIPAVRSLFVVFRYNADGGNGSYPFPVNDTTGYLLRRPFDLEDHSAGMSNTVYLVDRSAATMFLYQQYGTAYQCFAPQSVVTGDLRRDGESVSHRDTPRSFRDGLECFSLNLNTNAYTGGALPELDVKFFARCQNEGKNGGCRIGEVLIYTNSLTDAEQKRNLDYLMAKWGGAEGRRHWVAGTLSGTAAAAFDVPAGETADVRAIDTRSGIFVKTGGGMLRARHVSGNGAIRVEGGSVEFVGGAEPSVSAFSNTDPLPALGISSRFDASAGTADMVTEAEGGTNFVLRWNSTVRNQSKSDHNLALMVTNTTQSAFQGMRPFLAEDAAGRAWVDFGDLTVASSPQANTPTSAWMRVTRTDTLQDNAQLFMRELFWVWDPRPAESGANPILIGSGASLYERYAVPGMGRMLSSSTLYGNDANSARFFNVLGAQWAVDGVPVDPALDNYPAGPHVVRVSFGYPTYALGIGSDCLCRKGGFRLGELLVYTRELTDRERVETEAYLMRKWTGRAHPDYAGDAPEPVQTVYASAPASLSAQAGSSVRFSFADPAASTRPVLDTSSKTWIHIDASDTATVSYSADANGDLRVSSITDPRGNGKYAAIPSLYAGGGDYSSCKLPILRVGRLNGRNVIDLGTHGSQDVSCIRWWNASGEENMTSEMAALIVYANRDEGYFADPFSTIQSGNRTWRSGGSAAIFDPDVAQNPQATAATLYLDGVGRNNTGGGYPSGFHVLYMQNGYGWGNNISGVGADNQNFGPGGGMLLAEIYVFSSNPTEAESNEAITYLMKKWGIGGQSFDATSIGSISAAEGGTVVLDTPVAAASLSGAGTIRAASVSSVSSLSAAMDASGNLECLTVEGLLAFASGGTATISLASARAPAPGDYPIVTGATIADGTAETLRSWSVVFSPEVNANAQLAVANGDVVLRVMPKAMVIYMR